MGEDHNPLRFRRDCGSTLQGNFCPKRYGSPFLPFADSSGSPRFSAINANRSCRFNQLPHFFIRGLRKILVPNADGVKRHGCHAAYNIIHLFPEFIADLWRCRRNGDDDPFGILPLRDITAARIVEPVARPSSTRITVRPSTLSGGRFPRSAASRLLSSCSSCLVTASTALVGILI